MSIPYSNRLVALGASNRLCKAFGVKISSNIQIAQFAANAGFDALFIDLEHGWLSHEQAQALCTVALLTGISPLVRVPHQCGNGFVQRVLDGGAMGVIFPHIHSLDDARAAVSICKYPNRGVRSMVGQLPLFGSKATPPSDTMDASNATVSTLLMVESGRGAAAADEIAATDGVAAVVMGSMDLSIDLGIPGQWEHPKFREACEKVSSACRKHRRIFGLAGIYGNPGVQDWAINQLGARFMLVEQDTSILSAGASKAISTVPLVL